MMGGDVTVTSEPGKGSVFTVCCRRRAILDQQPGELFRVRNDTPNGGDGVDFELDRLDVELVAARGKGLLSLALQRIRGHAYDRDVAGLGSFLRVRTGSQRSRVLAFRGPSDHVWVLGRGQPATLLAVLSREDLESPTRSRRVLSM